MKDVGLQVIIDYLVPFELKKKKQTVTQEGEREMAFLWLNFAWKGTGFSLIILEGLNLWFVGFRGSIRGQLFSMQKSDISGPVVSIFLFFFFFTCLELIGFDQVLFEGTYYQREIRILKMPVCRLERNSCQKFFNMVMIIIIRALTSTTTAKSSLKMENHTNHL